MPTSLAVPAATPSGRSVVSRITSTGLPSAGASSCTPPLSVSMISASRAAGRSADSRAARSARRCRAPPSAASITVRTLGLRWTGKITATSGRAAIWRIASAIASMPAAEILAAVAGDADDPLAGEARFQSGQSRGERGLGRDPRRHPVQRVDHGVAGDVDPGRIDVLGEQRGAETSVGAKCRLAMVPMIRRLISSGQG